MMIINIKEYFVGQVDGMKVEKNLPSGPTSSVYISFYVNATKKGDPDEEVKVFLTNGQRETLIEQLRIGQ